MAFDKLLVDTDVIIDYLRGNPKAVSYLYDVQVKHMCYVSTITIAELYSGVREGNERHLLEDFTKEFHIAILNETLAERAGVFRRDYGKSHGVGLVDCIIAATAESLGSILITLNSKHFPMLKKVKVPYQK
ncbi:MAG: type II toxin-antitoxin system VapC family toxin [Parachlamydiaceae bacterium]|nr:type II toxin-antitoxin system VapC family toxin [Parachlamydiaceae bacterium]